MAAVANANNAKNIPSTPNTGKFFWKEETGTLEWMSNTPLSDKSGANRKKGQRQGIQDPAAKTKIAGRQTPSAGARPHSMTGRRNLGQERSLKTGSKQQNQIEENAVVEILDVKNVAFKMVSEVQDISMEFEEVLKTDLMDPFIVSLLKYFYLFFEKSNLENKPKAMYIETSRAEVAAYADVCGKMKVSEKFIGAEYCRMVLGIDMEELHHMGAGSNRVSATYTDRRFYESLYHFCAFVIWIAFKRKDYEGIRKELGRILRSDTFNPAIRVKNEQNGVEMKKWTRMAHEIVGKHPPPKDVDDEEDETESKPKEVELTAAEYRRLKMSRPAIKSIVNQRSPVIVSIMPSPKEDASYLFDRRKGLPMKSDMNGQEDNDHFMQELALEEDIHLGIIGDSLALYNPQTLAPVGAENDEEENDDDEEKKDGGDQSDLVRQATAKSVATTGGHLTDDEDI